MSFVDVYTDFIFTEDEPEKADIIFIPGSDEGALAQRGAALWRDGFAPLILPSGKYGKLVGHFTGGPCYTTECAFLCDILAKEGVPPEAILREEESTYTYENAMFSRRVTDEAGLAIQTALLCCQAYHARRASLYYQVCFPEARILVCPVVTKGISRESWYRSEASTELVLREVEHCGTQFGKIFQDYRKKQLKLPENTV
ncbi:MAG: YdcF family protein [Lachnospiraceae bacterium]|nr:YdcF family protein [Lachnospiraceae bacterium]